MTLVDPSGLARAFPHAVPTPIQRLVWPYARYGIDRRTAIRDTVKLNLARGWPLGKGNAARRRAKALA